MPRSGRAGLGLYSVSDIGRLAERFWTFELRRRPTEALLIGIHDFDGEIEDLSRRAEDDSVAELTAIAGQAEAVDPATLNDDERTSRAVLIEEAKSRAADLANRVAEIDVSGFRGPHLAYLNSATLLPLTEPAHAESLVAKWSRIAGVLDQAAHRLRQGMAKGRTPTEHACRVVDRQITEYLALPIDQDPFVVGPPRPPAFSDTEDHDFRDRLATVVRDSIRPGYERYRAVIEQEVLPKARPDDRPGLCWLPDGKATYAAALRIHTTVETTPHDVHQTGRDEIAHLENEYRAFDDSNDVAAIYERLRSDPSLRFETPDEIVAAAEAALARAEAAVPRWFGLRHQASCEVRVMPAVGAADSTIAYYNLPADDGSRPGIYFINTTEPATRTRFEAEALAFHESVPGHHLQLALSQELDLPDFRRHAFITAFHEGWGLYTERLADEMELYSGDVERLGMLSFDSWRSCRLVVDTGIHALGWSRQEAIEFMLENSPQATNNIANEVDRYIAWPGQATAYKTGQLAIRRARDRAQRLMGDRFDIKIFHDVLLGAGSLPLPVMEARISDWATD